MNRPRLVRTSALLGMLLVGVGGPQLLQGQELGTRCDLISYRVISSQGGEFGGRVTWLGRPNLACPDGLRIRADSAVVYEFNGRNELIGNVEFDTAERTLRARRADYFENEGRLDAWGNVVLTDRERGTQVRGDTLLFLDSGPFRQTESLVVSGGRPRATLPASGTGPGASGEPYEIRAQKLRFEGERFLWGEGQVEIERGELSAQADSLVFDQEQGLLILQSDAWVERGSVTARGGVLNLTLDDDRLTMLQARDQARIETEEFLLTGEDLQIFLNEAEEVSQILARGGGDAQASIQAEEVRLDGDEIEIAEAVDGQRVIRASGNARGEALRPEEESGTEPDAEAAAPLEQDWIEGNEVLARFEEIVDEEMETPPPDSASASPQYRLLLLEATGSARTLYHSTPSRTETAATGQRAISYVLADRIVVFLTEGAVDRLETEGNVRGIQLDPQVPESNPEPQVPPEEGESPR
jgi:lipopolysaccharide export system protein LptA